MNPAPTVSAIPATQLDWLLTAMTDELTLRLVDLPDPSNWRAWLIRLLTDHTVLLAQHNDQPLGACLMDLDEARIVGLSLTAQADCQQVTEALLGAAECQLAAFGGRTLRANPTAAGHQWMRQSGFEPSQTMASQTEKSLTDRAAPNHRRVFDWMDSLGIPEDYGPRRRLPLVPEAERLVAAGEDCFGRPQRMTAETRTAWQAMQKAAALDRIELQLISAYRDIEYQAGLIRRKLDAGQLIETILCVSAAPGFSEHHSGEALDLGCPDSRPLETEFSGTRAYRWLQQHARQFGFRESFPQGNRHGIAWEPWHWRFVVSP